MTPVLRRSMDRKVTNRVTAGGNAAIRNAFGLLSGPATVTGGSCPGATDTCRDGCYAAGAEGYMPSVLAVMTSNLDMLRTAGDVEGMAAMLSAMVDDFRVDCDRAARRGEPVPLVFRIHWDGDFYSLDYARAWARVIRANADVRFWAYTRSFHGDVDVLPVLAGLPNLTLYLSVDRDNVRAAVAAHRRHPWAMYASLADSFEESAALLPSDRRRYRCPENGGRLPLISPRGSACLRCGICLTGRGDVVFSKSHR